MIYTMLNATGQEFSVPKRSKAFMSTFPEKYIGTWKL